MPLVERNKTKTFPLVFNLGKNGDALNNHGSKKHAIKDQRVFYHLGINDNWHCSHSGVTWDGHGSICSLISYFSKGLLSYVPGTAPGTGDTT